MPNPHNIEIQPPTEQTSHRPDWVAAQAAMERTLDSPRHRAEEVAKETMERPRKQRAIEEEAQPLIYEDTEPGHSDEHLASSLEFQHPDTPQPTLDDTLAALPVPFPVANEPEVQGYSTQVDDDSVAQTEPRGLGRHVDSGGGEVQPAYNTLPQEDKEHTEEMPSAPFSRLLPPAPAPAEPRRDLFAEPSDTPHPSLDDARAAPPVPFPIPNEPEVQGYSTQVDDDPVAQIEPRGLGNDVHWGGMDTQPAYTRPQEDKGHTEVMPSPLFLPVPSPAEPRWDLCAERGAWLATKRRPVLPTPQKASHKLEPGIYTVTNLRWEQPLDLSGADSRSLIAFEPHAHGWENEQVSTALPLSLPFSRRLIVTLSRTVGVPILWCWFHH